MIVDDSPVLGASRWESSSRARGIGLSTSVYALRVRTVAASGWTQRRWSFSLAVFAGYAVTMAFWEFWTPWWAGDHIGLSLGAIVFYAVAGLLWTGIANVGYSLGPLAERFVQAGSVPTYRKYAHGTLTTVGALSTMLWFAGWMLEAWSRRR
jgi:hypothetical protein